MTLVILGERQHPEVKSINLWAHNKGIIVENEEDAKNLHFVKKWALLYKQPFHNINFKV